MVQHAEALGRRIEDRTAVVTVVGLGYVGLPTAVAFAEQGFRVIGADLNAAKVDAINQGTCPLHDLDLDERVARAVVGGRLSATADIAAGCRAGDAVLLIVPTPVDAAKQPDLRFVRAAARSAGEGLRAGQLVVLESTTYPGTTEEIVVPETEGRSGLRAGKDYGVAYCPERYNPGDPQHTIDKMVRVVGAISHEWAEVAAALYGTLNGGQIKRVRDLRTAEAVKVIENIQRDLNIALVNELALIFDRLGIDTHEVLDGASTKWNFHRYVPGPGVGGHCLPVDPYYLTNVAERLGYHPRVILAGRAVNDSMPHHVVELLSDGLNEAGRPVKGSKIAILGLAYKANTGDARESPAEAVVAALAAKGADLRLYDPYVAAGEVEAHYRRPNLPAGTALKGAEAVVILTDHDDVRALTLPDIKAQTAAGCVFVDARNVHRPEDVVAAGFLYRGVGRRRAK